MTVPPTILEQALALPPAGRAELVDYLLASLGAADRGVGELWVEEVERRIDAYERGEMKALKIEEVLQKYK